MTAVTGLAQSGAAPTLVSPEDFAHRPSQPVPGCDGVSSTVLWRDAGGVAALIVYQPLAHTPGPPHARAAQHIWVASGQALIDGQWLPAGSYVHVPAGAVHPIAAGGADGCVLLQVHIPTPAPAPACSG
jgi:quercetin dioxygenase-like cupin family protein